jgi:hypothetical protein
MAATKAVKYIMDEHTPTHIPCKFCGFPAKNYKALCAHLKACKKRFKTAIIRFIDEDLWIKGNKVIMDLISEQIMDDSFETAYASLAEKKAYFKAVSGIGHRYGKNIILQSKWGASNSFDSQADGTTEIYEI